VARPPAVVPEDSPVLQASEDVLDPGAALAVTAPGSVADDPVVADDWDAETRNSPVSTVGEDEAATSAEHLDGGARRALNRLSGPRRMMIG